MDKYEFGSRHHLPPFEEGTTDLIAQPREGVTFACVRALVEHDISLQHDNRSIGVLPVTSRDWHFRSELGHQHVVPTSAVIDHDQVGGSPTIIYQLMPASTDAALVSSAASNMLRAYWIGRGCEPRMEQARRIQAAHVLGRVKANTPLSKLITNDHDEGWIIVRAGNYLVGEVGQPGIVRALNTRDMRHEFSALTDGRKTHTVFK